MYGDVMNRLQSVKILFFIMLVFSFLQCAGSVDKGKDIESDQKEEDLIKLLNARQVKPPDMLTDEEKQALEQRVTELERKYNDSMDEINTLRSELLLKDEKIRQLDTKSVPAEDIRKEDVAKTPVKSKAPAMPLSDFVLEYQSALDMFMGKQYDSARVKFDRLLEQNTQHILSDNCQYWVGECYFALKDYRKAIISFEKVFTYLKSNKDDDSLLKLGICYFKLGDNKRAGEEFSKLINNYPESEYLGRARTMLDRVR